MGNRELVQAIAIDKAVEQRVNGFVYIQIDDKTIVDQTFGRCKKYFLLPVKSEFILYLTLFRLKEMGIVDFNSSVFNLLPETKLPQSILIKDLVSNTSGIQDYKQRFDSIDLNKISELSIDKRYTGVSTNVFLISSVIERVIDCDYKDFVINELFVPIGIKPKVSNDCFIMTHSDLIALANAVGNKGLLKQCSWKCFPIEPKVGCYYNKGRLCFDFENAAQSLKIALPQSNIILMYYSSDPIRTQAFCNDLLDIIEKLLVAPKSPKLAIYNEKNAHLALDISPYIYQYDFVSDTRTALAYVAANPKIRKAFLYAEGMRAIGFLTVTVDSKNNYYSIDTVIVEQNFQGKGYGYKLILAAIELLKAKGASKIQIAVKLNNTAALQLYKKVGFSVSITNEDYYIMEFTV